MPGLQEWIHKLEEGEWTRYIKVGFVLLLFVGLAVFYDIREFKDFYTQEAMDTAQLARNIAEGKGYTTDFIRPLSVYLLQKQRGEQKPVLRDDRHPDLANPPLYPMLLAGLMKIVPFNYEISRGTQFWRYQPEVMIAWLNQLLFFIAIIMVFRLGRRLFDAPVAWVSAIVFAGTDILWRFNTSGLSTMLLIVIFLGLVWSLVAVEHNSREGKRGNIWFIAMAVLSGALIGLGALTRYSFGWLILPVLAFYAIFFGARRFVLLPAALAAFVLAFGPWVVRNYTISGTPFGTAGYAILQETKPFEGTRLERYLNEEFEANLKTVRLEHFAKKLAVNVAEILQRDVLRNWITAFFMISLLIPFRSVAIRRLQIFLVISVGVLVVVQALGKTHLSTALQAVAKEIQVSPEINSENLLVLLSPVISIFGVALFFVLLDQFTMPFPQMRTILTACFALVICHPLILTILPPRTYPVSYPPYHPPGIQDISSWMNKDELMMSDMPWAVAWYGNRRCIWTTLDAPSAAREKSAPDFFWLYDYQKPIQGLYLTTLTTDARFHTDMLKNPNFAWSRFMLESLLRTNVPAGFPLRYAPPGLLQYGQLFLSDRPRWLKKTH